ncbi:MAG: 4Fe-4S dicluster domain-containing protein [Bacteroidales bacterium]|nr:4Fe-4S dicluster domain-containing protein [Bacteroidales bacterium]
MTKQICFSIVLLITLGIFSYTVYRLICIFRLTKPAFSVRDIGKRIGLTLKVAIGQTKIFRKPVIGLFHALVFWGFLVILIGSIEMIIDGLTGSERVLKFLGVVYNIIIASGDLFALVIAILILVFIARRLFFNISRFEGIEMKKRSHVDANIALTIILLLMVSLLGMNSAYCAMESSAGGNFAGLFPVGNIIAGIYAGLPYDSLHIIHEIFWWSHILLIFFFANMLPYSKHFHVFLSVPNVFLSRLDPLGKLANMDSVTKEVKLMLNPETAFAAPSGDEVPIERFGVKDVEDISWKNYMDALSCTQCGRCTEVCPANITGKMLSPRKIMMDVRERMKIRGPGLVKNGKEFTDDKSLIRDYITEEELWACTTCNACARECPINIDHPSLIVDMRRYLVMEEGSAPGELNTAFNNIENNGAPWQYSAEDRLLWAEGVDIPVIADLFARGEKAEYLFWVGCAGAFDDRYKKVAGAFARILTHLNVSFAVLGKEETCTGDPARRAGNEMLYQMQAMQNIETFKAYEVKKIITICPHCYNIFKNDYPDLGADFEVISYVKLLDRFIKDGKLKLDAARLKDLTVTYHDPCYLGRANDIYEEPRSVIKSMAPNYVEMDRNRSFALCCGAGGAQMFKEAEKGDKEIFIERTEDALKTEANVIATSCPFCMTMITDGLKYKNREDDVKNYDIAELIVQALEL